MSCGDEDICINYFLSQTIVNRPSLRVEPHHKPYWFDDKDFTMTINDYKINNGAKIITLLTGNIQTMPGLAKNSNYLNIDVKNDEIIGIF